MTNVPSFVIIRRFKRMNQVEYFITYVQGETPQHYLTIATNSDVYAKVPSYGNANSKNLAEWLLLKTKERFEPQGSFAIVADAKRRTLSKANANVPHIHNACWADIEAAFAQPRLTDDDAVAWFYQTEIEPHIPQLPEQQTIAARV